MPPRPCGRPPSQRKRPASRLKLFKIQPAWALVGLAIIAIACGHMLQFTTVVDDAFISFRAARHWVEHGVPSYNPGIREWVPTTFLWVGLLAGLKVILPASLPALAQVAGGACGLGVVLVLLFALPGPDNRRANAYATLLCAGSATWAAWPLAGMETALFALAVTGGAVGVIRYLLLPYRRLLVGAGVALGLATLTRPEGGLILAVSILYLVGVRGGRGDLAWFGMVCGLVLLPGVAYLLAVFGSVFPNSYFTKVHGLVNLERGGRYLLEFTGTYRILLFLPLLIVPIWWARWRRVAIYIVVLVVAWCGWVAVTGGDFMPFHRFLHPVWPLFCLGAGLGLSLLQRRLTAWRPATTQLWTLAACTIVALGVFLWARPSFVGGIRDRYATWTAQEGARTAVGKWFAGRYGQSEWMAVKPAGIIPYYSGMNAIDFFCLTDRKAARTGQWIPDALVGHQMMNPGRIHEIAPRVVILEEHLYPYADLPPSGYTDPNHGRAWAEDPRSARYRPARAEIEAGLWLNFFERR